MPTDVLVGPVALSYVQSLTITEGYNIQTIGGSKFAQAIAPTQKEIAIKATLIGQDRLMQKKGLEILALTSRLLLSTAAPLLNRTGIPVIAGLTISLDMQIRNLVFTQNVQNREALDVDITLIQVPRTSAFAVLGEVADLVLAAGASAVGSAPAAGPTPRQPGAPI
jgi:hypothetical protein